MVNTKRLFSLLLSISALSTSFAALAENSDCPPGAVPNSLCQQFQVKGVVQAKTIVTGQNELTLERVINKIQGETQPFRVTTNENATDITVSFDEFYRPSRYMGLSDDGSCNVSETHKKAFNLVIEIANANANDDNPAYQEFPDGNGVKIPFIHSDDNSGKTASFKLKFTSVADFGTGLEKLEPGEYSCDAILLLTVPA